MRVAVGDGVAEGVVVEVGVAEDLWVAVAGGLCVAVAAGTLEARLLAVGVVVAVLVGRAVGVAVLVTARTSTASPLGRGGEKERVRMVASSRTTTRPHSLRLTLLCSNPLTATNPPARARRTRRTIVAHRAPTGPPDSLGLLPRFVTAPTH